LKLIIIFNNLTYLPRFLVIIMTSENPTSSITSQRKLIMISSLLIIILVTSTLIILEIYFPLKLQKPQPSEKELIHNFYSQDFSKTNNVVLIGSSHVGMINATIVQENANADLTTNYTVYNIASGGNIPPMRLAQTEQIISMQPKLILYGVSYRDLLATQTTQSGDDFLLENIKSFLAKLLNDDKNWENPQRYVRLQLLNDGYQTPLPDCFLTSNTPLYRYCDDYYIPKSYEDLKYQSPTLLTNLSQRNLNALTDMLDRFNSAGIKTVIFVTPTHQLYFDDLTDSQKIHFDESIRKLEEKYGKIYDFRGLYDDLPIWVNTSHIITNNSIFDQDVATIIREQVN
jgi:hypothetical protein